MHLLYIPMTREEKRYGLGLLAWFLLAPPVLPLYTSTIWMFAYHAVNMTAAVLIFRRFLKTSLWVPHSNAFRILRMALLGLVLAQLANLLTNDLLFYFFPKYFFYNDTGPHFYNVMKEDILREWMTANLPLTVIAIVFFVPVVEELLHRGLVFGTIVRRSLPLAYVLSILLYSVLPLIPLLGTMPGDYLILSFIQYIPISVLFAWVYTRTESIYTPILAHILMNAIGMLTLR